MLLLDHSLGEHVERLRSSDEPVRVFHFSLEAPAHRAAELRALLSSQEQERADRFKFARHRLQFITSRAGLRLLLGALHGVQADRLAIDTNAFGKPYVSGSSVQFNLSHAGGLAVVAAAYERSVGVDLERVRTISDAVELAVRFFTPAEAERLLALEEGPERSRAFLECWTRKEAFVKAVGQGLRIALNSFEVSFFPDQNVALRGDNIETGAWSMHALDVGAEHYAALVIATARPPAMPPYVLYPCQW